MADDGGLRTLNTKKAIQLIQSASCEALTPTAQLPQWRSHSEAQQVEIISATNFHELSDRP